MIWLAASFLNLYKQLFLSEAQAVEMASLYTFQDDLKWWLIEATIH